MHSHTQNAPLKTLSCEVIALFIQNVKLSRIIKTETVGTCHILKPVDPASLTTSKPIQILRRNRGAARVISLDTSDTASTAAIPCDVFRGGLSMSHAVGRR